MSAEVARSRSTHRSSAAQRHVPPLPARLRGTDSHVAYPLLGYFRLSHDNLAWISALGTMLDAASLVLTTICEVPRDAKLLKRVGTHLVEDISNLGFHVGTTASLARAAFGAACDRLEEVGNSLEERDVTWPMFEAARATYADRL